jgi:hypothetical protein
LLLWGVPVTAGQTSAALRKALLAVSDHLGEDPARRSEPDVVLDFGRHGLVFVEVKYRSKNDRKAPEYEHWGRYLDVPSACFDSPSAVRASGLYELARYWRIGCDIARARPFTLVNLGPVRLFRGRGAAMLSQFASALGQAESRRFVRLTWAGLLQGISDKPDWLTDYVRKRGLLDG